MRNYETKVYDYLDKKTGCHVVKATTMYAGKTVSAYSKCDPNDTFNLKLGKDIALKRLDIKIAKKRAASMREYVRLCEMNLEFLDVEKRRTQKAIERANVSYGDRMVEVATYEHELSDMLKNI